MVLPDTPSFSNTARLRVPANHPAAIRGRAWIWVLIFLVVAGGIGGYFYFRAPATEAPQRQGRPGGGGDRATPVVVATARTSHVEVYLNGLGSIAPLATVTVKSRVDGQLMRVLFKEGQMVKAGDLLAEIDPRAIQVQLAQAEGQMAKDQALLANARIDLERYRTLFEQDSVAKQQLDTQQSLVRQYEGTVKSDQGAVDNARLQLQYSKITAETSGRVGLRQVDPGNIVRASDAGGLAVIAQLEPISALFALPEDNVPQVMKKLRAGQKLAVEAYDRSGKNKLASGFLVSSDNQIDSATGTVKLRAQFANKDLGLFPNQFVNIRMLVDVRNDAVVIPSAAVQRGQRGTFVYVAKPDSTVTVRPVVLGPVQGDQITVESGLAAGESVVIDGADKLREGGKITVTDPAARARETRPDGARRQRGGPDGAADKSAAPSAAPASATPASAAAVPPAASGAQDAAPDDRRKRWEEINRRIDAGEFGEEIKKLPEDQRRQRMRELRQRREGGGGG